MQIKKNNKNLPAKDKFMFYGEKEFSYFTGFVKEYYSISLNFKIILYRIDIVKSKTNDIYGESKATEKKYLTPIELDIAIDTIEHETFFVSNNGIFNENLKDFKFGVLLDELKEKNCVIKRGDFIKYHDGNKERNFEVQMVDNINTDNTAYGYKPFYTQVVCNLAKENIVLI